MPNFDELPVPAQNEIRQARGEIEDEHPQKTRMSLLQRLANVGLGRRDEESEPPIAARASGPAMPQMPPLPERKPQRSVADQMGARIRFRNMRVVRPRRDSTCTAVRHLWPRRHRATTIWISPLSCGGRPTESCVTIEAIRGPGGSAGALFFCGAIACMQFVSY